VDADAERRLVKCCQTGDRNALESLLEAHRDRAYRLAYRLTGSHADTDDVLQEAWLRVFRGMRRFDARARFGTWLCRIVLRASVDHQRLRIRRMDARSLTGIEETQAAPAAGDPSEMAAAAELNDALHEAMQALPVAQRSALVLVALEGMSYAEAAEVQQCRQGTLAWRVAEARRRLAEKLAPHLDAAGGSDHAM